MNVRRVLERLRDYTLMAEITKCEFFKIKSRTADTRSTKGASQTTREDRLCGEYTKTGECVPTEGIPRPPKLLPPVSVHSSGAT